MCDIFLESKIKKPDQRYWHRSGVFITNFEKFSRIVLGFPLYTLNMKMPAGPVKYMLKAWNRQQ